MESGIIPIHSRHAVRGMRSAIQGNVVRALVELVTNAEDSYRRLNVSENDISGRIVIGYEKRGYGCVFSVMDNAEGMNIADLRKFIQYGAATSGFKDGKGTRGYFGQGAKDALATMSQGKVVSVKDKIPYYCNIFISKDIPRYKLGELRDVDNDILDEYPLMVDKYELQLHGTIASFYAGPDVNIKVPRYDTLVAELSNNYMLRKIMSSERRTIILVDCNSKKRKVLRYKWFPEGKLLLSDNFSIQYEEYQPIIISLNVYRTNDIELTQAGDIRSGGILILDESDNVLDLSLFNYDNEPLASKFFGEAKIDGFRFLLSNEEPVLREERSGLDRSNNFSKSLIKEIENRLAKLVAEERKRRSTISSSSLDDVEIEKFRKTFDELNRIAEQEIDEVKNLSQTPDDNIEDPPNGFCLYPSIAHISVGKKYNFELRMKYSEMKIGGNVHITTTSPLIKVLTDDLIVPKSHNETILRKFIRVTALESNIEGELIGQADEKQSRARIFVVPSKDEHEQLYTDGLIFQPETVTLKPNKARIVRLLVYTKIIDIGSVIKITSDNLEIGCSPAEILISESESIRHIAKYNIEIFGTGEGENAIISAECDPFYAMLEIKVRSKEPEPRGNKGMFSEPDFNNIEEDPNQRSSYSSVTGKVIIYTNFPSVKLYLGSNLEFRKSLPAQILIADLVAEQCFNVIARRKAEKSGALITTEGLTDYVLREALKLSKRYGRRVHELLVDESLLKINR